MELLEHNQVILLEMRKCLAMIEMEVARANREINLGDWQSDHHLYANEWLSEYNELKKQLKKEIKESEEGNIKCGQ